MAEITQLNNTCMAIKKRFLEQSGPTEENLKDLLYKRLRRGQVFAIHWRKNDPDNEFGVFMVDWHVEQSKDPSSCTSTRLIAFQGFKYSCTLDTVWPRQHSMILDLKDVVKIERFKRTEFDKMRKQLNFKNDKIARPVGAVQLRSDQGRDTVIHFNNAFSTVGDETTEDEDSAIAHYDEKKFAGDFESSFEELPDQLDRMVIEKFGEAAWRRRCIKHCEWFTSRRFAEPDNAFPEGSVGYLGPADCLDSHRRVEEGN
ncbi:hypothetical protein DAPPUDRAFT_273417 [Daphnia pulex]|uniref:Uncharacterized protein n=1 Tax=Daphnia pulex TaxID=6669 RepID=E9I3I9_DAPPU|nr:hypothetical protein DAPPUDRAFT_273417 [Daphnia pulex]|eukprot:EFX61441.1 hypothetical protein DAPPUDRAFT_273417 [Daphnia pulex]